MSRSGLSSPGGGAGAGRTANNTDYFVDTKLLFRLKRFVTEQQERGSRPTEDSALDYLLDKFKEYVRKPQVCTRCVLQISLPVFSHSHYCTAALVPPVTQAGSATSNRR